LLGTLLACSNATASVFSPSLSTLLFSNGRQQLVRSSHEHCTLRGIDGSHGRSLTSPVASLTKEVSGAAACEQLCFAHAHPLPPRKGQGPWLNLFILHSFTYQVYWTQFVIPNWLLWVVGLPLGGEPPTYGPLFPPLAAKWENLRPKLPLVSATSQTNIVAMAERILCSTETWLGID
jgi:hypothetical protein